MTTIVVGVMLMRYQRNGGDKQFGQIERKREQAVPTVQKVQFRGLDK